MLATLFGLVFFISLPRQPAAVYHRARAVHALRRAARGGSLDHLRAVHRHLDHAVFFISAASFGALSLYGYTTRRDLSRLGSFLVMGLIGIVLASLVNLFIASSALQFAISVIGVLVFTGLTAWDTQRIKESVLGERPRRCAEQEGAHGCAGALSRLHQPLRAAAAPVRRPPLSITSLKQETPRR